MPLVAFDVVVFACTQLDLFEPVVPTEGVDFPFEMNSSEEGLFLRHVLSDFDCHIVIVQVVVLVSVAAHKVASLLQCQEHSCEMSCEVVPVATDSTPLELVLRPVLLVLVLERVVCVLLLLLVVVKGGNV